MNFFLILSVAASTTETFAVTASTYQITFDLPTGTTFNGSISTSETIRVWVSNANGSVVANLGLIDNNFCFSFITHKDCTYYVYFENPLTSPAQVTFSFQTEPDLLNGSPSLLPFSLWPIFVIITVVGCVVLFYLSHRNRNMV